ncbi:MAG TPA: helix-turn-helix transcriptional regulator [Stellaceae bacterium]|nr:helix-turn-helix transcriptional regulator [Stellaceae bacterium]
MAIYPGMNATMIEGRSLEQRRELGEFVRAHRERLTPAAFGLPGGSRRRTPGLRREEVAQLCGLSATWYTWIEQGRDVSVSPTALARLAGALRLGRAERAYLFELAGKRDPDHGRDETDRLPAAVLGCVAAIASPAYLLDRRWTARSWNEPAERLFVGWLDQPGERNLLRFLFLMPAARALVCGWEERARRVAAEFRAAASAHLGDPDLRLLIEGLRRESADFARFWDEHGVLGREGGERTFNHPTAGFLRYEQVAFTLASGSDLTLTMLIPSGSVSAG